MNIYISNLGNQVTLESLFAIFAAHGKVSNAAFTSDPSTGLNKGIALIEMPDKSEAIKAIAYINGCVVNGKTINVDLAIR